MEKNKKVKGFFFKRPVKKEPLRKMYMYTIIVNSGFGQDVMELLQNNGSNAQCTCIGRGTANKEALNILGLENNRKDVVLAFVDESNVKLIRKELGKFFLNNKKFMGIGFTTKLSSVVGEKVYHFLTNTL